MRVALVVMPFASADRPSLAAGLLKASLAQRGIACDVKHFNLTFWKMLGHEAYTWLSQQAPCTALAGEWVFSQALFGDRLSTWDRFEREVLDDPAWGLRAEDRPRVREAAAMASAFLEIAFASTDWSRYDVVGFTSTFEQTLSGLALAAKIRAAYPRTVIVAGGANYEAPMGGAILEAFDCLDYVATGESEEGFPELCTRLAAGRSDPPAGFLHRRGGTIVEGPPRAGFTNLDTTPVPDYDDYFRVLRANDPERRVAFWYPVEGSRGCWWGAVSHCTFCGLNGDTMTFRRKSWRRVVAETDALQARHGRAPLQFGDTILAMPAFHDLIPFWAARRDPTPKLLEVKSNLKRSQIRLLREAGVTSVQPGIESLSDTTLKLMKKGVSAAWNVAMLRWCAESGIEALWNVIFGFPGEDVGDAARTLELMRKMVHLRPPDAAALIRMDRFSPNFERFAAHGFTRVSPMPAYGHVFPMDEPQLRRAAYFFAYDHPDREGARLRGEPLVALANVWREKADAKTNGRLALLPHLSGGRILVDDRFTREPRAIQLTAAEEALLVACDAPTSRALALEVAARHVPDAEPTALDPVLSKLIAEEVVAESGESVVTLATMPRDLSVNGLARAS